MRIFNKNKEWGGEKINFVDDNNVLVGYDMGQSCCEHADWFINDTVSDKLVDREDIEGDIIMEGWSFDTSYFKEVDYLESEYSTPEYSHNKLDDGGMVIFRLVNGDQEKFLHLFNCHNGYYGHGFEFQDGDDTIQSGVL